MRNVKGEFSPMSRGNFHPNPDLETESLFPSGHCEHLQGAWQSHCKRRDCFPACRQAGVPSQRQFLNRNLGFPLTFAPESVFLRSDVSITANPGESLGFDMRAEGVTHSAAPKGKEAPLRVNPERAPAFMPGSRRVDIS